MEAISIPSPDTSTQQGRSMIGSTLTEADRFQVMGSGSVVIVDPFGMGLTESSVTKRWWEVYDVGVLGKELGSTLYDQ